MVAYSYNYLPGPLVFFIIGHLIYRKYWGALALALLPLMANQFHLIYVGQEAAGFNRDLYVGLYGGLIAIFLLKEFSSNSVDYWMGAASYGCFLGHYSILIALRHYGIFENSKFAFACLLLATSIFVGLLSFLIVEKPTLNFRRKWRIAEKEKI